MGAPRPTGRDTPGEIFGFSLIEPGLKFFDRTVGERDVDDRGIALIVATVLEQSLETALLTKLIPLSDEDERQIFSDDAAPLFSFDPKIRMAFALGIIGREARADLTCIRNVRNTFAHSRLRVDFDTPEIVAACDLITLPTRAPNLVDPSRNARERFISTGFQYVMQLVCYDPNQPGRRWSGVVLDTHPLEPPSKSTQQDLQALQPESPKGRKPASPSRSSPG